MHDIHTGSFARVSRSNFSAASQDTENLDKIKWLQEFDKEPQTGITSPLRHVITFYILHTIHIWLISNQIQVASSSSGFPWHPPKIDKITTMFWGSKPPQNTTDFSCSSLNWYLDILACSIQLDPCKKTNTKVPKQSKAFVSDAWPKWLNRNKKTWTYPVLSLKKHLYTDTFWQTHASLGKLPS